MNFLDQFRSKAALASLALALVAGCDSWKNYYQHPSPLPTLGYASDPIWQIQERNGEASDFVIYDHEFTGYTARLNSAGEDHLKQIAARLGADHSFPVIVARSEASWKLGDLTNRVMHVLWERREASIEDIEKELGPTVAPSYITVEELLAKMETRGLVRHRLQGREQLFHAIVNRDAITNGSIGQTRYANEDEAGYPVHHNPVLDMKRRDVVVRALVAFGVEDADDRVVVAPALAEGFESSEAERAYHRGLRGGYGSGAGFGGGGGGGFGF